MKIKHRARTEHTLNKASATLFCRYSKRRIKSHYSVEVLGQSRSISFRLLGIGSSLTHPI
ncbi:hypothetical protein HanPSC8_Chr07g0275111 [Helianthus annuus]|nr:hypothetical protein HanPSC8_Chr07g0275111 [Helianthus annuus]